MLADRLGMTVGELMARMSAEEYVRWRALFEVEGRERQHAAKTRRGR